MQNRTFGKTNRSISEIGLGTWQLGSKWGEDFNPAEAEKILQAAYENGINFIDTADVYIGGNSEKAIGQFLKNKREEFFVVTKSGRQLNPHTAEMYTPEAIEGFIDESLLRLNFEYLDMVLLHCPPSSVYQKDSLFAKLDSLKKAGKIAHYGVSIEKVSEGIAAMEYDISAIEVIFNMFRQKPAAQLLPLAKENNIGIIARVPLASGLLTGKFTPQTTFGAKDHRTYNRGGEAFDKEETFSGVDYATGLAAVEELKALFGTDNLAPYALRWILMFDAVSTVIPGASNARQVGLNVVASELPPLSPFQMEEVERIYEKHLKQSVHTNW